MLDSIHWEFVYFILRCPGAMGFEARAEAFWPFLAPGLRVGGPHPVARGPGRNPPLSELQDIGARQTRPHSTATFSTLASAFCAVR